MRLYVFFCLLLNILSNSVAFSQVLEIQVQDENNLPLDNYTIYKNSIEVGNSKTLVFRLNCKINDKISISHLGNNSEELIFNFSGDTVRYLFTTISRVKNFDEVKVSYSKYKLISDKRNENVLDFLVFPEKDSMLILKSIRNKYFLESKSINGSIEFELKFKPDKLFLDIFGNSHIVANDTVYQIWFDKMLKFTDKITRKIFNTKILPLVARSKNFIFYEYFNLHNKNYKLTATDSLNKIYDVNTIKDEIGERVASIDYNLIINQYNLIVPPELNIIQNGLDFF
jgi:hypothetical protein